MLSPIKKIIFSAASIFILVGMVSCSGVTETGNPCGSVECDQNQPLNPGSPPVAEEPDGTPGAEPASSRYYTNSTYGVRVQYPSGWTKTEGAQGDSVIFSDNTAKPTSATMNFSTLAPEPVSLITYLERQYPTRSFVLVSIKNLTGLMYDDLAPGANGGDTREYFFLKGNILIHVIAEVSSSGVTRFAEFLDGILYL